MLMISDLAPVSPVAKNLLQRLNKKLHEITGDTGAGSYKVDGFNEDEDAFIVASIDGTAVACGGLRKVTNSTCEIKRMYSEHPGGGTMVLDKLEQRAGKLGYKNIILSTRRVNKVAVNFYLKRGYDEISPYGKYQARPESVCLGKTLNNRSKK